jgi:hypothetical protein
MKEKLLELIINELKNGNYGLLENLLNATHSRHLLDAIPQRLYEEVKDLMVGQTMYVVSKVKANGLSTQVGHVDPMLAIAEFNSTDASVYARVRLHKAKVIGGNSLVGWKYDMVDAEFMSEKVLDLDSIEGTEVSAVVSYRVSGKLEKNVSNEDLLDHLQEVSPIIDMEGFILSEVLFEGAKIDFVEK